MNSLFVGLPAGIYGITEIGIKGVNVASVPSNLNGVANCPLHPLKMWFYTALRRWDKAAL